MPSISHETLVDLFRSRPALAVDLLRCAVGPVAPAHDDTRLSAADLPDLVPTEFRADGVVELVRGGRTVGAVIVEIQQNRDADKRWTWPVYVTTLRARLRCRVDLLVVCPNEQVARWCREPIVLDGSGSVLRPAVTGPDLIPVVEADESVPLELVVLSALAHGGAPEHREVLDTLVDVLGSVEAERELLYLEVVYAALPEAARRYLEERMTATPIDVHRSELAERLFALGREKGEAEGKAEGKAEGAAAGKAAAVLAVLEARGLPVAEQARSQILACSDHAVLDVWVRRAAVAATVEELFV